MVLRVPSATLGIACGGHPMLAMQEAAPPDLVLDATFAGPSLTGKRYVDEAETMEFLCTKGGAGTLSVDGVRLAVKQAKALPSSD